MNILFLLLPCTWLLTGGWLFITSAHWDFTAFGRTDFLIFSVLWGILGLIVTAILTLAFLHLPAHIQALLKEGATYIDQLPAKTDQPFLEDDRPGLLSLRNIVLYNVIDPFGHREQRAQERDWALWEQTKTIHE